MYGYVRGHDENGKRVRLYIEAVPGRGVALRDFTNTLVVQLAPLEVGNLRACLRDMLLAADQLARYTEPPEAEASDPVPKGRASR